MLPKWDGLVKRIACEIVLREKRLSDSTKRVHVPLQMVPEPVDQWQNVNGQGGNMLEQFYRDPERYAYTFQNYVFITRVMQARMLTVPVQQ